MPINRPPNYAPIALDFFAISVSVATSASAVVAGVGPFAGIFVRTSASFTVISPTGASLVVDNAAKNTIIWVNGAFLSAIATATSQFGLV